MCFFAVKTINESLFRLLNQQELTHSLILIFNVQIQVFDCLLRFQEFLLNKLVWSSPRVDIWLQRLDSFVLISNLWLLFNFKCSKINDFGLDNVVLLFDSFRTEIKQIDVFKSTLIFGLQIPMQRVKTVKFWLELKTKLHLLFMGLDISVNFILQLFSKLLLLIEAFTALTVFFLHFVESHF